MSLWFRSYPHLSPQNPKAIGRISSQEAIAKFQDARILLNG